MKNIISLMLIIILGMIILSGCELTEDESGYYFSPYMDGLILKEIWAIDFVKSVQYKANSYLMVEGDYCKVYIDEGLIYPSRAREGTTSLYDIDQLTSIAYMVKSTFDNTIYEKETAIFGEPTDIDGDGKVIIFLLDILDGYAAGYSSYIGGYFNPRDQFLNTDSGTYSGQQSNEMEIFYMDMYPSMPSIEGSDFYNTLSHEFYHMLNFRHKILENPVNAYATYYTYVEDELWINEGTAELATDVIMGGYRADRLYTFYNDKSFNRNLQWFSVSDDSEAALQDYASAYMYMRYLTDIYDDKEHNFLMALHDSPYFGFEGLNYSIGQSSNHLGLTAQETYMLWISAFYHLAVGTETQYPYTTIPDTSDYLTDDILESPQSTTDVSQFSTKLFGFANTDVQYEGDQDDNIGVSFMEKNENGEPYYYYDSDTSYNFSGSGIMAVINMNEIDSADQVYESNAGTWAWSNRNGTESNSGSGGSSFDRPMSISGYPFLRSITEVEE